MKKLIISSILMCISFCSALAGQLAAGGYHSLILKENGTLWSWGYNNDYGQLGDGTTIDRLTPVPVVTLTDLVSISAGYGHSLAVKRDGTAWAWGYNAFGQLGNGVTMSDPIPIPTPTPGSVIGLSEVIDVSGGLLHSLLLKSDGTVWACGANRSGQLGDGTESDRNIPVQVYGLSGVIAIAGGEEHSLALKRDGTVWAWGYNAFGQLGDGNGGFWPFPSTNHSTVPIQVSDLSNVIAIASGNHHSLALKNDGTVWAWGLNTIGQLGDGNSQTNTLIPVQSLVSGIIAIGTGAYFSLSLTSYGMVLFYGWLDLDNISNFISSIIPVPVDGISGIKSICGASDGNHALAFKNDGTIWAWGNNSYGQLGDDTTTARRYPVQVQGLSLAASSAPASVLAADFDADGKADPTAVSATGQWFFWHSSSSYSREGPIGLGMSGTPCAGDVDGDGIGDMALVNNSGSWFFWLSSHDYSFDGPYAFGVIGTPVLGDFDGDSKADPAIVSSSGLWTVWLSGDGYSPASASFAVAGATPLAADFDGDGRADPVMVSATGNWYFWLSGSMFIRQGPYYFGLTGKPVAGDFDGDGKADPAVMDSSGNWYFWFSHAFYTRDGPYYLVLP